MGPEFNELWKTYFKDKPDKPVMCVSLALARKHDSILVVGLHPSSREVLAFMKLRFDYQLIYIQPTRTTLSFLPANTSPCMSSFW